ncbi:MAG: toll/interleukin-1 receptor domain-containing protein [Methyloversatilis sp.]|nr:toll/interleukin-1 receptor domain-containing protein [Methyloversatilis sp.]
MNSTDRKKVAVITSYVQESFSESDWYALGQLTGQLAAISKHPRLFRALSFGDDDYAYSAAEVLDKIFSENEAAIGEVIDHFDIDLWYQQKSPEKYQRLFSAAATASADFWKSGYLRLFVSHLSSNRSRMSALKAGLATWGISAFIAHEDIEASREWRDEVEAGLETMEVLAAVVEPGFKESDWCVQEVGYALGRKVDIIPLRAGLDPFGFFGKYQGIQIKGRLPEQVACDIAQVLLKKPQHREKVLQSMSMAFSTLDSEKKVENISMLDGWSMLTDAQLRAVMEQASMSAGEKQKLKNLIARVGAFKAVEAKVSPFDDDDIPF